MSLKASIASVVYFRAIPVTTFLAGPTVTLKKKPELLRLRLEKVNAAEVSGAGMAAFCRGASY